MNRISSLFSFIASKIGNVTMGTTATTITGAIAEHEEALSTLTTTTLPDAITWKPMGGNADIAFQEWVNIPEGAKEVYVAVFVVWDANRKVSVDFIIPVANPLFNSGNTGSSIVQHVNFWGTDSNGFVRLEAARDDNNVYSIRVHDAYNGTTSFQAYSRMYYR